MGVRFPGQATTTATTTVISSASETAIVTSAPINVAIDFQQLLIFWYLLFTCGTGTTSVNVKLYRGTGITGTLLNSGISTIATLSQGFSSSGVWVDTPGAVAGVQYTISVQQQGGTGAGTGRDVCIAVMGL